MPESIQDTNVLLDPSEPVEWRGFTIPGNKNSEWDDSVHGVEISEEDAASGTDPEGCAVVSWRPGEYSFSTGSCGASIDVRVPEGRDARAANPKVLQGFHELLKFTYDE